MSKPEKDYGYNEDGEKILAVVKRKNYEIEFVEQKNANKNLEEFYRNIAKIMYNQALEIKEKKH
ncbi:hypothetical protein [Heyndrickxia ginsengihumi]|uniref:hypothetical protein n=1 Tax=Heyndrickxia ginsengihumi TaxID=363870 RepID=UPI000471C5E4|nr:hypothetical protein [Heyndrickxia ginsengihumi]